MGRTFKTPKQSDKNQWKKVELLWKAGFRFIGHGRDGPPLPKTLQEAAAFIANNPEHPLRIAPDIEERL